MGVYNSIASCVVVILLSVDAFTDGGKDIAFGQYGPTWKLHRRIASKALRYV